MSKALRVTMWPQEHTRTAERSCYWIAQTDIAGQVFTGRSRYGAVHALARTLVAAGIPDAPLKVFDVQARELSRALLYARVPALTYPSFHEAAKWTYSEGNEPLRLRRYRSPEEWRSRVPIPGKNEDAPADGVNGYIPARNGRFRPLWAFRVGRQP